MATAVKDSRFDVRMTAAQRREIEQAASIQGKSLTQWALDHLLAAARYEIEQENVTRLSRRSFSRFVSALESPMPEEAQKLLDEKAVWE